MESIHNFAGLVSRLSQHGQRKRVAVVCASDEATLSAVARALKEGFVEVISWAVGQKWKLVLIYSR